MQVRLLSGPAGSGKTFRCLAEIREALLRAPEGLPLVLVAPDQTTFQLERQLLADPAIPGYTRLHILSFKRLANFILELMGQPPPELVSGEGRVMVLRALLARKRNDLKLFRASARLTGFAQQLSLVLGELQRHQLTPELLNELAEKVGRVEGLAFKLQDLATLLGDYLGWLKDHNLQDGECLLGVAAEGINAKIHPPPSEALGRTGSLTWSQRAATWIEGLWVDGFAELSPQELELLAELIPHCAKATLTFCLEDASHNISWLSNWSVVRRTFEKCKERLEKVGGASLISERLERDQKRSRFSTNPILRHLEAHWEERIESPNPKLQTKKPNVEDRTSNQGLLWPENKGKQNSEEQIPDSHSLDSSLRVVSCANPEAEAMVAAREILRYVRAGGRYREVSVLVRKLEGYHHALQRVFSRYEIPFFLDRRESVSHHPMAELTREALRTITFGWQHEDFFAALKTGLVEAKEEDIDWLENEALARGWKGSIWEKPIVVNDEECLSRKLSGLQARVVTPFQKLALALEDASSRRSEEGQVESSSAPSPRRVRVPGRKLADALREFWAQLNVEQKLQEWAGAEISNSEFRVPNSVHASVWAQMKGWLENVELAFADEALGLREWLPILEAGLVGLTVGVIPPALDQVLIGAVDRSRNPDIKLALVLGLNETVFPASPQQSVLLTETDRDELAKQNVALSAGAREQLSRERYLAYIACTRARERLVLTYALHDANGSPLNPSPFLANVKKLFPKLEWETAARTVDWRQSEHANELIAPMLAVQKLKLQRESSVLSSQWSKIAELPTVARVLEELRHFQDSPVDERLAPGLASSLYGPILRTSVSRMEQFAACPFQFFIHSGLRAEDRKKFEVDVKEQGSFQHEALARFHEELAREKKRWREITPEEARKRMRRIAAELTGNYRDGLLQTSAGAQFAGRVMTESLQDFVEILVGWMREQYGFDPVEVELPFGEEESSPAWEMGIQDGNRLALHGRIDRVDLWRKNGDEEALCAVMDYKSSQKRLDPVLMDNGVQLQLLAYLAVLRHWPKPENRFGVKRLIPAGVFYVSLRGKFDPQKNRRTALADSGETRKLAYQHTGRFDSSALRRFDSRTQAMAGDQFNYRLNQSGEISANCREPMETTEFEALLDSVEENLKQMGRRIFDGTVAADPYRKGTATACDQCNYADICRIDRWTHTFRALS